MSYPVKKVGPIPCAKRKQLRASLPQRCVKCGATEALTLDHIVARGLGGTNDPSNLQLLCHPCNQRKGFHEAKEAAARLEEERKMQKQERAAYFRELARQNPVPQPQPKSHVQKPLHVDLIGQLILLRKHIQQLEQQLQESRVKPAPEVAALQNTIDNLRAELDKEKGISRVGRHVTNLPQVLKSLRRVLKYENRPAEERILFVHQIIKTSQAVIDGFEPEDWQAPISPTLDKKHTL